MAIANAETHAEIECISDRGRAAVLLAPPRLEILREAREPASASAIAERLRLGRQKVNYHVRALAAARFLRKAGTRRKRNMIEQRYVATARAYVLGPEVLRPLGAHPREVDDVLSASYLLALSAQLQSELGRANRAAAAQRKRLPTLSMNAALRFDSAAQRARFANALHEAIGKVIGEFSSAFQSAHGGAETGRPYRLVVGCYPIPGTDDDAAAAAKDSDER